MKEETAKLTMSCTMVVKNQPKEKMVTMRAKEAKIKSHKEKEIN